MRIPKQAVQSLGGREHSQLTKEARAGKFQSVNCTHEKSSNESQILFNGKWRSILSRSRRRRRQNLRSFAEGSVELPAQRHKAADIRRTMAILDALPRQQNLHREEQPA